MTLIVGKVMLALRYVNQAHFDDPKSPPALPACGSSGDDAASGISRQRAYMTSSLPDDGGGSCTAAFNSSCCYWSRAEGNRRSAQIYLSDSHQQPLAIPENTRRDWPSIYPVLLRISPWLWFSGDGGGERGPPLSESPPVERTGCPWREALRGFPARRADLHQAPGWYQHCGWWIACGR